MTFYQRYLNGEYEQVYQDIDALGQDAFLPHYLADIQDVLTETFQRVAYNLDVIATELKNTNYVFFDDEPLQQPLANTDELLAKLDNMVAQFGYIPLSLKYFYKIVGGVDLVWDYNANPDIRWQLADPLQIIPLDSLFDEVEDDGWQAYSQDCRVDGDFVTIGLSADDLHKDNISGGTPYSIEITAKPSIDSQFLYEVHDTTFINYLRICFEYCGFPAIAIENEPSDYQAFFAKVKPLLKKL